MDKQLMRGFGLILALCLGATVFGQMLQVIAGGIGPSSPPFDVGFDFRATQAYVTGDYSTACLNTTTPTSCVIAGTYPTSAHVHGYTFTAGFEETPSGFRNRTTSNDVRLGGIIFNSSTSSDVDFRVDLPAPGAYTIHLAIGDPLYAESNIQVAILDNTTTLFTVAPASVPQNSFVDANNATWTNTAWPTSETGRSVTFSTTILRARLVRQTGSSTAVLAHLRIVKN